MQLGSILDKAKHSPSVTFPVVFRVGTENASAQKSRAEARAVLVYVSTEEVETLAADADVYLTRAFKDKPITSEAREAERQVQFLAVALRDEQDPAMPFADGGADQLRTALLPSVADELLDKYREFVRKEYHPSPAPTEIEGMRKEAQGK